MARPAVPAARIREVNDRPLQPAGDYVLYWMSAARRVGANYGLQRAVERAREFDRPLLVLEALRAGYAHASDRLHRFVLQGMADNATALARKPVRYYPYVEPAPGDGRGLLRALGRRACVVVCDDFPCFFLPRAVAAAARQVPVRMEQVDSNGLLPMRATDRIFGTAAAFRRWVQKRLPEAIENGPLPDAVGRVTLPRLAALPRDIAQRWPPAERRILAAGPAVLAALPLDHAVAPAPQAGGARAAQRALQPFVRHQLADYAEQRNHPDLQATSGLSPWLHFGHLASHQVLAALAEAESWSPQRIAPRPTGGREGWWRASAGAEAFLDQLVVWRELGFNRCALSDDYAAYEGLPEWARNSLAEHAADPRPALYALQQLTAAATDDALWNAAQRQLRREGRIHGYLRMVWGKNLLSWSRTPQQAFARMLALNDRWALDGRDPNSYSGMGWCLGRYDRPWGPELAVFGKVRYMTSANTRRKLRCNAYLRRYGPGAEDAGAGRA